MPHIEVGTLAVDGWTITFGTAKRGLGGVAARPKALLAVPNVTAHSLVYGRFAPLTFRSLDVSPPRRFAP